MGGLRLFAAATAFLVAVTFLFAIAFTFLLAAALDLLAVAADFFSLLERRLCCDVLSLAESFFLLS